MSVKAKSLRQQIVDLEKEKVLIVVSTIDIVVSIHVFFAIIVEAVAEFATKAAAFPTRFVLPRVVDDSSAPSNTLGIDGWRLSQLHINKVVHQTTQK